MTEVEKDRKHLKVFVVSFSITIVRLDNMRFDRRAYVCTEIRRKKEIPNKGQEKQVNLIYRISVDLINCEKAETRVNFFFNDI